VIRSRCPHTVVIGWPPDEPMGASAEPRAGRTQRFPAGSSGTILIAASPDGPPEMTISEQTRSHRLRVMSGRDPYEQHRTATALELLYDLTFVVAFGVASEQLAHLLAEGHYAAGLTGFVLAVFAICWAWINFSWFASAYDTDDPAPARVVVVSGRIGRFLDLPRDDSAKMDKSESIIASRPGPGSPAGAHQKKRVMVWLLAPSCSDGITRAVVRPRRRRLRRPRRGLR
jgi:hypothetical protein